MSRYGFEFANGANVHLQAGQHASFHVQRDRNDEQGSMSGSDDENYTPLSDTMKGETDTEGDSCFPVH